MKTRATMRTYHAYIDGEYWASYGVGERAEGFRFSTKGDLEHHLVKWVDGRRLELLTDRLHKERQGKEVTSG
jgi:hypothetical protein